MVSPAKNRVTMSREYDYMMKMLFIGESNVGKSSLIIRFISDLFDDKTQNTISTDFKSRTVELADGKRARLQIWDTAGQERFRTVTTNYYRSAHGIFLVYDIADKTSYSALTRWYQTIEQCANENVIVMLLGNKCDKNEQRQVESKDGESFAAKHNMKFFETSAKDGTNLQEAFLTLAEDVAEKNFFNNNKDSDLIDLRNRAGVENSCPIC